MKFITQFLHLFTFISIISCGGNSDDDLGTITSETKENKSHKEHVNNIFNNIPDPVLISKIITESNLDYQPELLNDPTKFSIYNDEYKKSLNLGIYGTDLSYASMFEQTQECLTYLKCVNQLCKNLGINGVFDEKTSDRIDANKNNRDSLLSIISESFNQIDEYLIENKRGYFSSLIMAAGWIEGMYISTQIYLDTRHKDALNEINKHEKTLISLISLIDFYETDSEELKKLNTQLKKLLPYFKKLNSVDNSLTEEIKIENIKSIHQIIAELRNEIIK